MAKTPLCAIPDQLCPGAGEPGSAVGFSRAPGVQSPVSLPSWAAACGALGGLPHPAVRCGNTSSCSWQFDVSLGWSCKSLFCFWFLLWLACPGFTSCLWSLLQILLVVHVPWLPDPSLGFSSCFLLTLRLSSFGFLGPKCDHAFLFKPLAEPNSFCLLWFWAEIHPCVSVPASRPSSSLALTCRAWLPVSYLPVFNIQ